MVGTWEVETLNVSMVGTCEVETLNVSTVGTWEVETLNVSMHVRWRHTSTAVMRAPLLAGDRNPRHANTA